MTEHHMRVAEVNSNISGSLQGEKKDYTPLSQGAGQAVQSIAQSIAIAVQDSVDTMRNMATVQSATIGVATQKYIETKDHHYIPITEHCHANLDSSVGYWEKVGKTGASILAEYKKIFQPDSPGD